MKDNDFFFLLMSSGHGCDELKHNIMILRCCSFDMKNYLIMLKVNRIQWFVDSVIQISDEVLNNMDDIICF